MFSLNTLPHSSQFIFKNDQRILSYQDNPTYCGNPDAVYLVRDFKDVAEILKSCHQHKIPVTFCGSRTSLTGSSAADSGLSMALEPMNKILDIGKTKKGRLFAKAQPGIILGDLKRAVADAGYFYPPDPTSLNEAQLGATVATNATGEDTYLYGPTRQYIRELKILTVTGEEKTLARHRPAFIPEVKASAGYFLEGEEIDLMIGSEGTLTLITEITVDLLPASPDFFSLVIPLPSLKTSIKMVQALHTSDLKPRAIELIGPGALEIMQTCPDVPSFPDGTVSLLYVKKNFDENTKDEVVGDWLSWIEEYFKKNNLILSWTESIFFADTPKKQEQIRSLRHFIPTIVNERARKDMDQGGGKIATDWWVPINHLADMMEWTHQESLKLNIPFLVFAHIGNGHPHWNFLTRNPEERERAEQFLVEQSKRAVSLGGGVAGEHGIGKLYRKLLPIQRSKSEIQKMIHIKQQWDPHWILGRGNLFKYAGQENHPNLG